MHALIVGGSRFVGLQLAARLLAGGHRVTLFNRGTRADPFGGRVTRLRGDRTRGDLERLVAGRTFDAAFDFAAYTADDGLSAVRALAGRVGHYFAISSGQVYLVRDGAPQPAREEDDAGPLLPRPTAEPDLGEWEYGVGKRGLEEALAEAWTRTRFPATWLRIPMVNGERDHYRRIERYLWRLRDGEPVLLPDGGTRPARHVYGGEVARFLATHAGDARVIGRAVNLAQEEVPTVAELVGMLRELLGSSSRLVAAPSETLRLRGLDPAAISPFSTPWMSFVDPAWARDHLGFRHAPLAACLASIVASWIAHPPDDPPPHSERRADELAFARSEVGDAA